MKGIIILIGIVVLFGLLYLISSHKKEIKFSIVIKGILAQFIIALLLVKFPFGRTVVSKVSDVVTQILSYGFNGLSFVFGSLAAPS